ncbi:MAG: S-layer homology domain-containing protein [Anaerolineales bacterium]|nr:S-layer homology domain-containing protein [Anaerolineales bacterium]
MKSKNVIQFILVLVLAMGMVFSVPATLAHAATTITVTTLVDEVDATTCPGNDCSLREAIQVAGAGDTINFGVTGTITLTMGVLVIGSDMTITGPGAGSLSIDGNNASRVFFINSNSADITISNLTVQNGRVVDNDCGGIFNQGNLTLDHAVVKNNHAVKSGSIFASGGGICSMFGGTLTITNSEIKDNTANFLGGGIYAKENIFLTNVIISGNSVFGDTAGGSGGGIALDGSGGETAVFDRVQLINNSAKQGGAMQSTNFNTVSIQNSLIFDNEAVSAGGALDLGGVDTDYILTNVTISGNAQTPDAGSVGGGAIWYQGGGGVSPSLSLIHTTITNNIATGTVGSGGIHRAATGTINLKNTILAGNSSLNSTDEDCSGAITSQDYNIIQDADGTCAISGTTTHNITGVSGVVNALADNGGATQTHSLPSNSPALDAIPNNTNGCGTLYTVDQRGASRPQDGNGDTTVACDIGAFEVDLANPAVTSITRANANPPATPTVEYQVAFSEAVTGVDTGDFALTPSGDVIGTAVTGVSGSGKLYTVSVNVGLGSGTVRLDLVDNDTVVDGVNKPLGGSGAGNGSFTTGESYNAIPLTFSDVPTSHFAVLFIERLFDAGITGGCATNPLSYCPDSTVTRAQMAVFLEKGIHGSSFVPPNVLPTFTDTAGNFAEDFIEALKNDGVTSGCGVGIYCPDSPVTRAQMAIFLLKAKHGASFTPPDVVSTFTDTAGHFAEDWIEQLAAEGITSGCGAGIYCPDSAVTRAQMAIFLVKTFNLP